MIFSQNNARRHFSGTLGIPPGGPLGHAKTPEEEGKATFMITMVSLALNRVRIFKTFTLVLPGFLPVAHRSLHLQLFCFLCLYNIVVLDSWYYGDCPGQVVQNGDAIFYSCIIIGGPNLSVIPPPPLDHCAAVYLFCPMEGINLVFLFHFIFHWRLKNV